MGRIDNPVPYYAAADAYVQPTFYDPCSLVVLEALASGLPVVTSRFNGVSELLTQGREGYVIYDPADHYELAEALVPMFNPARRAAMGQASRRWPCSTRWNATAAKSWMFTRKSSIAGSLAPRERTFAQLVSTSRITRP